MGWWKNIAPPPKERRLLLLFYCWPLFILVKVMPQVVGVSYTLPQFLTLTASAAANIITPVLVVYVPWASGNT